jgi:hypothetical protein
LNQIEPLGYDALTCYREADPEIDHLPSNAIRPPVPPPAHRPKPASDEDPALPAQIKRALSYLLREGVLHDLLTSHCAKPGDLVTDELRGATGSNYAGVAWRGRLGYLRNGSQQRRHQLEERTAAALRAELAKPHMIEQGDTDQRRHIRDLIEAAKKKHADHLEELVAQPFAPSFLAWWHNSQTPVWRDASANVTLEGSKWTCDVEVAFEDKEVGPAARRLLQAKQWGQPDVSVLFVGPTGIDAERLESYSNAGITVAAMRAGFWEEEQQELRRHGKIMPRAI